MNSLLIHYTSAYNTLIIKSIQYLKNIKQRSAFRNFKFKRFSLNSFTILNSIKTLTKIIMKRVIYRKSQSISISVIYILDELNGIAQATELYFSRKLY